MKRFRVIGWLSLVAPAMFIIPLSSGVVGERPKQIPLSEQSVFSEEYPIQKPVVPSPAVLRALMKTREVKDELDSASDAERRDPALLFRAAEVHLTGSREADLVVAGVGPMRGADNDWYWVLRSPRTHPKVVLFAGCNALELMRTRTNGYRNIETTWSSASQTLDQSYHFDGVRYRLVKEKWSENPRY